MKNGALVLFTGACVLLEAALVLVSLGASDHVVWAEAGAASVIMMLLGGLAGSYMMLGGLLWKNRTAIICGGVLVGCCAMPLVLLLAGATTLGL